jgi:hypothetical protein
MAKKAQGKVNKSQAIRDLLKENPKIKANDAIATLAGKGIPIKMNLFYFVKGNLAGQKKRRKKNKQKAVSLASKSTDGSTPAATKSDALATIQKIKALAGEVGGLRTLKSLVDVLSE